MEPKRTLAARLSQPGGAAALAFLATAVLQGFHELEHIVQVFQRFVFNNPKGAGILGTWLDIEPVHFAYNAGFLALLILCFWLGVIGRHGRHSRLVFGLMAFVVVFQTYHFIEHIFKLVQFLETMKNGTPGILGSRFNLVWLHFTYNTVEFVPFLVAFFLGGFHKEAFYLLAPRRGNQPEGRSPAVV